MIHKEDMEVLEELARRFNVISRQEWARLICQGDLIYKPVVQRGLFGIEYVVPSVNRDLGNRLVSQFKPPRPHSGWRSGPCRKRRKLNVA